MISHWDDGSWTTHEHGELRCERRRLSSPRGGAGVTLSRCRRPVTCRRRTARPPTIVALDDLEPRVAGSRLSGLAHVSVTPGRRSSVRHCHSHEDEIFVVLDGSGTLLLDDERTRVTPGTIVARPAATGVAHSFEAGGDAPMTTALRATLR